MERITYRITLDTHKTGIQRTLQGFETGNNMSRRISMNLVASGDTFEIPFDHVTAMMYVLPQDAKEPSINKCTIVDNTIVYDVLPTDIATEGITEMQIKVIEGRVDGARKVLVSPKFALEITESSIDDESAEKTTTFTALEDAVAKAEDVYNSRLVRVEITEEYNFRAYYADGSYYETDALYEALHNGNALLSQSYAIGGTGIRDGEDTDNSKYYSNVSRSASANVNNVADEARDLLDEARLQTAYTAFNVNFETGNLDYASANYKFDINEETGDLEAESDGSYVPEQIIGNVINDYVEEKTAEIDQILDDNSEEMAQMNGKIEEADAKSETALAIAKGKNQARVFATTADMHAFLSDEANKGVFMKGDNLYIAELDVPDWWIAEVLETPNADGRYYEIAQLETQKVDLTNYATKQDLTNYAPNTALGNYMPKSGGTFSGMVTGTRFLTNHLETVPMANSFSSAGVTVQASTGTNSDARAGVGFHNVNHSGAYLYYESPTNGFYYVSNTNDYRKILDTNNTQTLLADGVDLNGIRTTGIYRLQANSVNGPTGMGINYCTMFVARHEKYDTMFQIIINYTLSQMAYRGGTTSAWGAWQIAVSKSNFSYSNGTLNITI